MNSLIPKNLSLVRREQKTPAQWVRKHIIHPLRFIRKQEADTFCTATTPKIQRLKLKKPITGYKPIGDTAKLYPQNTVLTDRYYDPFLGHHMGISCYSDDELSQYYESGYHILTPEKVYSGNHKIPPKLTQLLNNRQALKHITQSHLNKFMAMLLTGFTGAVASGDNMFAKIGSTFAGSSAVYIGFNKLPILSNGIEKVGLNLLETLFPHPNKKR